MLTEEVRTGKLGGICSLNLASASGSNSDSSSGDSPQVAARCDLCGTVGLVLPALPVCVIPCFPGQQVTRLDYPTNLAVVIPGLPFSRGPPAVL